MKEDSFQTGVGISQLCTGKRFDLQPFTGIIQTAERLGFHSLWVTDQPFGPGNSLEPLTVMSYAAALTDRVRIGAAILVSPVRHPVHLARSLASIDQLSRGRLIAGLGLGGAAVYEAFGLDATRRSELFTESIELLQAIWTRDHVDFSGHSWLVRGQPPPKPIQQPRPPILLAATTKRAVRRALGQADGWIGAGTSTSESFVELAKYTRSLLTSRDYTRTNYAMAKRVFIGLTELSDEARQLVRSQSQLMYRNPDIAERSAYIGTLDGLRSEIMKLGKAGANILILHPLFEEEEHLRVIAEAGLAGRIASAAN